MKIRYLAHSSFLMTSASGTRIITDPYTVDKNTKYGALELINKKSGDGLFEVGDQHLLTTLASAAALL